MIKSKREKRKGRQLRIRASVRGTSERPRVSVFRSNRHIWAQLIDDVAGKTIVSASDMEAKQDKPRPLATGRYTPQQSSIGDDPAPRAQDVSKERGKKSRSKKVQLAGLVGELIAKKAGGKKISYVVFDRGGYKYHGMVKAVADGARKGGLKF